MPQLLSLIKFNENTVSWPILQLLALYGLVSTERSPIKKPAAESLKGLRKTIWGTTKKCENKNFNLIFISMQLSEMRGTLSINSSSRNRICGNVNKFRDMTLSIPKQKQNIREMCLGLIRNLKTTVLQLAKVLGHLISSI